MVRASSQILGHSLREHIGGRWAISWWVILVSAPFGLIVGLNNMAEVSGGTDVGRWILVSLIGVVFVIAVLAAANFTLFRKRASQPVPIWWVVTLGAVAGASRSAVTVWVSTEWDLVDQSSFYTATRIATGAALGAVILPLAALLASIIATYVNERRALESDLRQIEVQRMRESGRSEALREALISRVEAELAHAGATISADDAREVSRRLWESSVPQEIPKVQWRQALRVAITHNPYPTVLTCVLWTIAAFGSLVLAVGFSRALVQIMLSLAAIVGCFGLGRYVTRNFPRFAVTVLVAVILVLTAWTGVVAPVIVGVTLEDLSAGQLLATAVWIPTLVVSTGVVVSAVRSGDEVVRRLREAIEGQQVAMEAESLETFRIQQELATLLHGSVQSRLLAAAAVIRQPAMMNDYVADPQAALQGALTVMSQRIASKASFQSEVEEAVRSWIPLMQVAAHGIDCDVPDSLRAAATRVIEEGLSNAFRHGRATAVDLVVTREPNGLRIQVIDDGSGPPGDSQPGLGSAVLESLAPGAWSLMRDNDERTVLDVLLRDSES